MGLSAVGALSVPAVDYVIVHGGHVGLREIKLRESHAAVRSPSGLFPSSSRRRRAQLNRYPPVSCSLPGRCAESRAYALPFDPPGVYGQLAARANERIYELVDLAEILGDLAQPGERGPESLRERIQDSPGSLE